MVVAAFILTMSYKKRWCVSYERLRSTQYIGGFTYAFVENY